ncbi:MAG: hypothetical protein PHQ19_09225 [Candidatus Krumholzibacteria bacterium]|nr:hypothetical protein [Candidatus Krumholzibacteria bacterium]
MKAYGVLAVALAAMLLFGCSGAKYQQEKTLLSTATKAIESLTAAINEAGAPEEIASAVNAFAGQFEKLVPAIKKINDEHPDWENNPPSQLKDAMEQYKSASNGLQEAMPRLMQMASEHMDNTALQDALKKFQSVVSGL